MGCAILTAETLHQTLYIWRTPCPNVITSPWRLIPPTHVCWHCESLLKPAFVICWILRRNRFTEKIHSRAVCYAVFFSATPPVHTTSTPCIFLENGAHNNELYFNSLFFL